MAAPATEPRGRRLSVAMITPFRDGQIDVDTLQQQVEFQIEAGTTCVCPVGTTGESPTLSHPEHERVISAVVEAAAGRSKVMAGTGSNSTDEALRLTRNVEHATDGALELLRHPVTLSETPTSIRTPPPIEGAHTREILQECGYQAAEIDELIEERIVATANGSAPQDSATGRNGKAG